jgi:hypothetical protein
MPGSAVLGDNLIDSDLLDCLDEIRGEINPEIGLRQYRVYSVLRSWSGGERGAGTFTEVETELTPQPLVESFVDSMGGKLMSAGLDEAGLVRLREVSLTYTAAEIKGGTLEPHEQWLIRLKDAYGQGEPTRDFVVKGLYPDRLKDIGWVVSLARASDAEAL